jgi:alpha-N-arabinofuranosidase
MWQICILLWLLHGMQVVPAQTMLENADKDIDVVLSPYSLTSSDLLTEWNNISMPQIDSFSRSSN